MAGLTQREGKFSNREGEEEETRVTEALLCWEKEEDSGVKNRKKNDAETGEFGC